MKFTIENKSLFSALSVCKSITKEITTTNCLVETAKDKLIITASSDTNWISYSIPAQVEVEGKFCTRSDILVALKLQGKESAFEIDKGKLTIKSGRTKIELDMGNLEDLSINKFAEIKLTHKLEKSILKTLLDSLAYDSDVIESTAIKVVDFRSDGKTLKLSTNDKYCLGYAEVDYAMDEFQTLLPLHVLTDINSFLTDSFEFGIEGETLRVSCGSFDLLQKFVQADVSLADASQEIKKIRKETAQATAKIDAQEIRKVLDEAKSFSKEHLLDSRADVAFLSKGKGRILSKAAYGTIEVKFNLQSCDKDCQFRVSLYLFSELLSRLSGDITIKYFGNKVLISDNLHRNYIMPTLVKA